jgi:hypothetical protein
LAITSKAAIGIVRLLRLLLTPAPWISPELRIGRKQKSKRHKSRCGHLDGYEKGGIEKRPGPKQHHSSDAHWASLWPAGSEKTFRCFPFPWV